MKNLITLILLCSFLNEAYSQVKVNGIVKDSIGNPIELANVIAYNQINKAIEWYNITGNDGRYELKLAKHTDYELTVSFIGMKSEKHLISTDSLPIKQDFTLYEDLHALDEVQIKTSIPLHFSGDTLTYDVESFRNSGDRKLEDVLRRLPGVKVDEDGKIFVEGKEVKQIMVEGKPFFGGGTKMASKKLPADVLDKIQVLKQHDNISQLKNVRDNDDNVAINVKLKEGKKNFWFGDIEVGGGIESRYLFTPSIFYYSPRKSINIIGDINNIGEAPLNSSDLSRFTSRMSNLSHKCGTDFPSNSGSYGHSISSSDKNAKSIESQMAGVNINYSPASSVDITGFTVYNKFNKNKESKTIKQFLETAANPNPTRELTTNNTDIENDIAICRLSTTFQPNLNNRFSYDISGEYNSNTTVENVYSTVLDDIKENRDEELYSLKQNLDYYFTLNDNNIFAFESEFLMQKNDPFYNAVLNNKDLFPYAEYLGFDQNQMNYSMAQEKLVKTNKLDATLNYWHVINRKSNININAGIISARQDFNTELFQFLDNGNKYELDNAQDDVTNDVRYNFDDWYLGLLYRLRVGSFTFTAGATANNYYTKVMQENGTTSNKTTGLFPYFRTKVQLKSTEYIKFTYQQRTRFAGVDQLAEAIVLNNYSTMYRGNVNLTNPVSEAISLEYTNAINALSRRKHTNINASIHYHKASDAFRNAVRPDGIFNALTTINSTYNDESLSGSCGLEKGLGYVVASANGSLSQSKYKQVVNDVITDNESLMQRYDFKLRTNFFKHYDKKHHIEASVGYNWTINDYNMGVTNSKFITESPYSRITYSYKDLTLKGEYFYSVHKTNDVKLNEFDKLNMSLTYQKRNSLWSFKLTGYNLLNTNSITNDSFNDIYLLSTQTAILPRFAYASIIFSL